MTTIYQNDTLNTMEMENIELKYLPELEAPLLIAGFEGWGNALEVSRGMINYLIQKLEAKEFGRIKAEPFYSFESKRPTVEIKDGIVKGIAHPSTFLYVIGKEQAGRDLILLKGIEPSMQWFQYTDCILSLCKKLGVQTLVSIGGMYDHILHTDTIISVVASDENLLESLKEKKAYTITYKGLSSIHSTLHAEAKKQGFRCVAMYCHCPYYLQGTTHFGLLSYAGDFLADWAGFSLDTDDLAVSWKSISKQIQDEIDKNPELQNMVNDIRKAKIQGVLESAPKYDNVIQLQDFFKPR
ncbi:MAG: PAC2 family protein [Deltaproteobacteria bacterium]|nr:PAC2 family protein [Deltaproteobacteria bacterium]